MKTLTKRQLIANDNLLDTLEYALANAGMDVLFDSRDEVFLRIFLKGAAASGTAHVPANAVVIDVDQLAVDHHAGRAHHAVAHDVLEVLDLLDLFGLPVQLLRALCAVAMAVAIGRLLSVFQLETIQRITAAQQAAALRQTLDAEPNGVQRPLQLVVDGGYTKRVQF